MKRIESPFNVLVLLPGRNGSSDEIVVEGPSVGKVSAAKKDILDNLSLTNTSYHEKFKVPAPQMDYIAGKNGWNLKRTQSTYGVRVFLPLRSQPSDEILLIGPSAGFIVTAAKENILGRFG